VEQKRKGMGFSPEIFRTIDHQWSSGVVE